MPKIAIIARASGAICHIYDAPAPSQKSFGGEWSYPEVCTHLAIPEDLDTEVIRAVPPSQMGYGWSAAPYVFEVDPEKYLAKEGRLWQQVRNKRNQLLADCDWTQVADAPLTEEKKEAWRAYRQALRDLPGTIVDVWKEVAWPDKP